jgi:hypothetical protein
MTISTYTATIYVGLQPTPKGVPWPAAKTIHDVRSVCRAFVNERVPRPDLPGGCVTITPTEFVYGNGGEPGVAIGLINYPRFPSTPETIREAAMELAARLRTAMQQQRVTVVFPDNTVMLEGAA